MLPFTIPATCPEIYFNKIFVLSNVHLEFFQIIGDDLLAILYLMSDGVIPKNIGRGYVVCRLIRGAVRVGRLVGVKRDCDEGAFLPAIAEKVIELIHV